MNQDYKKIKILKKELAVIPLYGILILLVIVFTSVYISLANNLTKSNYQIQNLENNLQKRKEKNQSIRIDIAEIQSNTNIQTRIERLGLIKNEQRQYIDLTASSVAQK